jgi:hypothetical protein
MQNEAESNRPNSHFPMPQQTARVLYHGEPKNSIRQLMKKIYLDEREIIFDGIMHAIIRR